MTTATPEPTPYKWADPPEHPDPDATHHQQAAELSEELGLPVTYSSLGFRVRGQDVSTPTAVRAIAGPPRRP